MIDPRGLTLERWSAAVLQTLGNRWSFGRVGNDWRRWAVQFLSAPGFSSRAMPDPYGFTDWREWAMRAYPMLQGGI